MPNYRIDFYGTPNGGLNSAYKEHISRVIYANNKEGARLDAYRTHEHIHDTIIVEEIVSVLDEEDTEFVRKAQEGLLGRVGPGVGDAVLLPNGSIERIIARFGSEDNYYSQVQLDGGDVNGSYHLMFGGGASYSGAGGDLYELNQLEKTAEVESVKFWIAHHDNLCGGCARYCMCDVNVWKAKY